jgi:predicted CXXCH cytochrome family protein
MRPISFLAPTRIIFIVLSLCLTPFAAATAVAAPTEVDCTKCHTRLVVRMKIVHAPLQRGCPYCHTGIADALKVPHKKTNAITKGLSAEQPGLCYGCHDRSEFMKKVVHAAVGLGCTGCHTPHAGNNEKLLVAAVPDLCFNCHDKGGFTKTKKHSPVEAGRCLTCHDPHSSNNSVILVKSPYDICLDCHDQVKKSSHAGGVFGKAGHPLGRERTMKGTGKEPVNDPKRKGEIFSCASCHNPHSSDEIKLFRYPAKTPSQLCSYCHTTKPLGTGGVP